MEGIIRDIVACYTFVNSLLLVSYLVISLLYISNRCSSGFDTANGWCLQPTQCLLTGRASPVLLGMGPFLQDHR